MRSFHSLFAVLLTIAATTAVAKTKRHDYDSDLAAFKAEIPVLAKENLWSHLYLQTVMEKSNAHEVLPSPLIAAIKAQVHKNNLRLDAFIDTIRANDALIALFDKNGVLQPKASKGMTPAELESTFKELFFLIAQGALVFENLTIGGNEFLSDDHLRQLVSQPDPVVGLRKGEVKEFVSKLKHLDFRTKSVKILLANRRELLSRVATDPDMQLFHEIIVSTSFVERSKEVEDFFRRPKQEALFAVSQFEDGVHRAFGVLTYHGSKAFGNVVGKLQFRMGKLYMDPGLISDMVTHLRPLDVITEATPFRLTDKLIPGEWGHSAVWIGNEQQLRELGIWEHPSVVPHQPAIRQGQVIFEALRSGVEINTPANFSNIDSIVVMRRSDPLPPEAQKEKILWAVAHLGEKYNFNFDLEQEDALFCSQVVPSMFPEIPMATSTALGHYTNTPALVLKSLVDSKKFTEVLRYEDGVKRN